MEWESKFSSIVRETESNLAKVRDRLNASNKTKASGRSRGNYYGDSSTSLHTVGNLRSQTSRPSTVAWDKLRSPKTVGMTTNIPSGQASPALVNALFERVEEQAELVNYLNKTVMQLEKERETHAGEIKRMKEEINKLSERLRERGVDIETERKLEQFKRDVYSQLEFVESQTKLRQSEGENSHRSDSAVINEMRRIVEDETESIQRSIEHLKTKLSKMELEIHSTITDSREVLRKQDRLDRLLSSLSENQRTQSRSLSSVVDERQSDAHEIQELKHLVSKLSRQYSELESELQSSISNNSSIRHPRPRPSKQTRSTNGSVRSMRRGKLSKSNRAQDDLVLSSSNGSDLSLSALDVSSPSDTDFTSVQLEKSNRGISTENGIGNISSTSLSSLNSDDLLK